MPSILTSGIDLHFVTLQKQFLNIEKISTVDSVYLNRISKAKMHTITVLPTFSITYVSNFNILQECIKISKENKYIDPNLDSPNQIWTMF